MIRYQRVGEYIVLIDKNGIALPFKICDELWCWWGRDSQPAPAAEQRILDEIYSLGAIEGLYY